MAFLNSQIGQLLLSFDVLTLIDRIPAIRATLIDIDKCEKRGGPVRIIASIEYPDVIQKTLKHLGLDQPD